MNPAWHRQIDQSWTLFLDRDGVINRRLVDDYVKQVEAFTFFPDTFKALEVCAKTFGTIVVVTNQQGVGKGLMTEDELNEIHQHMISEVEVHEGRIDDVFYCTGLAKDNPACRKPNSGMAYEALKKFPEIDFSLSVMVGDSPSDMEFGERLGMKCIRIGDSDPIHDSYPSLFHFVQMISS